jgi:hypothetical protein
MAKLTPKEKEIAESVERGEWKCVKADEAEKGRYKKYAESTLASDHQK